MQSTSNAHAPRLLCPEAQPLALRVGVLALFSTVVLLSGWRVLQVLHRPGDVPEFQQGLTDFHHIFVYPATAAQDGVNPYSAEFMERLPVNRQYPLYSPVMFWMSYPLTFVSLAVADSIYFTATVLLVVALAASALSVCRLPRTMVNVFGLATLILLSRPGHVNLLTGQPTLIIVLGAVWALELARRRPNWAGVALAVTTLKPTFGVPFIWFLFCRRDYRAVTVGVAITCATIAAGFAPFVARQGLPSVLTSLREGQAQHEVDPTVSAQSTWTRMDAHAMLGKWLPTPPSGTVNLFITAVILLSAGWIIWRTKSVVLTEGADNLAALLICTATLVCIYHATYDALLLIVSWVGLAFGSLGKQVSARVRAILLGLLTIPAVNYLSARTFLSHFEIEGSLRTTLTSLNGTAILAAFAIACVALYSRRQVLVEESISTSHAALSSVQS